MSQNNSPSFSVWQHETLVQFAGDAYAKLVDQAEQIARLQLEVKELHAAYRKLVLQLDDGK